MKLYNIFLTLCLLSLCFLENTIALPLEKRYSTLKKGSSGAEVKSLQSRLVTLGYSVGPYGADGDFGAHTQFAVYAFQQANGLATDGIAGPATQTSLFGSPKRNIVNGDETTSTPTYTTLKSGSTGVKVKRLQTRLALLGYNIGSSGVDGDFGPSTLAAVKSFQTNNAITANGVATAATQKALFAKTAVNSAGIKNSSLTRFVNTALSQYTYKGVLTNGSKYTKFGSFFSANPNNWCAMFVSWVGSENNSVATHIVKKTAAVSDFLSYFKTNDRFVAKAGYRPKFGDIMILKSSGASHVTIVVGSDATYVWTIEGNYSNAVNVVRRRRDSAKITGYGKNNSSSYGYAINTTGIVKIEN